MSTAGFFMHLGPVEYPNDERFLKPAWAVMHTDRIARQVALEWWKGVWECTHEGKGFPLEDF